MPPCLPAKSLFKRLSFALMSRLHIVLDNLGGLADLHAVFLRLTELEHWKGLWFSWFNPLICWVGKLRFREALGSQNTLVMEPVFKLRSLGS